jgi:cytochrome b
MQKNIEVKTFVWTLPNRIFHWLLALGFVMAYILGDFEKYHNLHFAYGAMVGTLLFFRILFGFFGPTYARFRDFPISLKNQLAYFKSFFKPNTSYAGHNPAAGTVMLAIFIVGLICSLTGFMLYNAKFQGFFEPGIDAHTLKEFHEIFANAFLVLVIAHLTGVFVDFLLRQKEQTLVSMVNGYKNVSGKNASLNKTQQIFSIAWIVLAILLFILAYNLPTQKRENDKTNVELYIKN